MRIYIFGYIIKVLEKLVVTYTRKETISGFHDKIVDLKFANHLVGLALMHANEQ